jgi:phage tail tape measure protein, TP901 family, core region
MSEGNNFFLDVVAALQSKKSQAQLNKDIKSIQKQIDKLQVTAKINPESIKDIQKKIGSIKVKAEIAPNTIQNLTKQLENIINQKITLSNIDINQNQITKAGQQIGKNIDIGVSASLGSIRQNINNVIKEFGRLSSADLSKMFNLNRSDMDSSVLKQVRGLTNEINGLSKEILNTGSSNSWDNIISKVDSLSKVLDKFGKSRDMTPFKESLDILKQFEGKKIFVNNKSELFQNTGMSIRKLNNEFRNLDVTFTTSRKNAIDLDSVWDELFTISPNLEKYVAFGDQINAIIEHLKIAKEAMYGDSSLQPVPTGETTKVLAAYLDRLGETSTKLDILREQETEIKQNAVSTTDTVVKNEQRKQEAYKQTAQEKAKLNNFSQNILPQVQGNISNGFYADQVQQQIEKYNRLGVEIPNVKSKIDILKTAEQELNTIMNNGSSTIEQQRTAYLNFQSALRNANASNSIANNMYMTQSAVDTLTAKLQTLLHSNTNMTETTKSEINGWIAKLQQTDGVYKSVGESATATMKRIQAEQVNTERSTGTLAASLKNSFSFLSYWVSPMYLLMQGITKVKQAFTELKEVNSIMTEISKVSKMTSNELNQLGKEAFRTASDYGKSISDYLTGIQDFSRAGFQGKDAQNMAELSVLAQAAGDMSADLSNQYLIATDAAYKLKGEASKLNDVLDGQNFIANRNATSMTQLANATKITASQAASSGVAVNEMSAAIGTMIAVTQDSGEVAGRAFKAILMNLQQVSGELDDGEIIDEESLTKYEKACNALGVSLKTVKDGVVTLRDPMQILNELSEAYTSLDKMDARRANLISAIGGKHRGNQLNALLENWSTYEKMLVDYSEGSGSAMNEAMKSANNWEGSLNRLKNTWVNTVENIANSDAMITIVNSTNSLLDIVNKLTSKLGSIGTAGIGIFAVLNKGKSR